VSSTVRPEGRIAIGISGGLARIADLQHARFLRLGLPRQALLEARAGHRA
jgi:hypothetical protein